MKERTGAREGDTPGGEGASSPLACLLLARPFFLVPTTSKRLLLMLNRRQSSLFFSLPKYSILSHGLK